MVDITTGGKYMEKIREFYLDTKHDDESIITICETIHQYPTEMGYRVESFTSPKFVRISVYKE